MTLLRAAGFPVTSFQEGRDLLAKDGLEENPYFAVHENQLAVYDQGYKMVFSWNSNDGPESELEALEIFRVVGGEDGLREEENLLADPALAEVIASLTKLAEGARDASLPTVRREFSKQDLVDLAALGYVFSEDGKAVAD